MERSGQSFFYHADGLGSITELTDASGAVTKSYTYSSFGKIESETNPTFFQPYMFTAREFDLETGLYYYRARYYDAVTGRFLSEDPLGKGPNLYSYALSNPPNRRDPYGLWALIDDLIFAGGGAMVGLVGQGLGDVFSGTRGSWEDYLGAALGGAIGGEVLLYGGPVVAGAAGGAATNIIKQFIKNRTGKQCGYDALSYLVDTGIGTVTGLLPGFGLPGISSGRNSFNAIYKQMATKFETGQISRVTPQTASKMFVGRLEATGGIPGTGAAAVASGLGNISSVDRCPCQ
jgi:RHS repeat-associated protein